MTGRLCIARCTTLDGVARAPGGPDEDTVADSIKPLATSGLTLVVIEQNVEVALATTEHIVVLRRGETVYAGTKEDLGADYRAELTNFYV